MKTETKESNFDKIIKAEIIRSEKAHKESLQKKTVKKVISKKDKIKVILMSAINQMNDKTLNHVYAAIKYKGPIYVLTMGADEAERGLPTIQDIDEEYDAKLTTAWKKKQNIEAKREHKKWDKYFKQAEGMK